MIFVRTKPRGGGTGVGRTFLRSRETYIILLYIIMYDNDINIIKGFRRLRFVRLSCVFIFHPCNTLEYDNTIYFVVFNQFYNIIYRAIGISCYKNAKHCYIILRSHCIALPQRKKNTTKNDNLLYFGLVFYEAAKLMSTSGRIFLFFSLLFNMHVLLRRNTILYTF